MVIRLVAPVVLLSGLGLVSPTGIAGTPLLMTGESPLVTVDVPGYDVDGPGSVHCWYVDPVGLEVEL